ncbi:MAG: hypothetical protein N2746_04430 [Deltaproteobacteria bacterium]|nr:hypothetical protein [Deltaproteobacteria bacterium]
MAERSLHYLGLLVVFGIFFYHCGTTTVVDDQVEDTHHGDTVIRDTGRDYGVDTVDDLATSDSTGGLDVQDVLFEDSGEDIASDVVSDIVGEDINLKDVFEDASVDIGSDSGLDIGRDGESRDQGITDTLIQTYSIEGKVTINGGKPESGKNVYIMLFDQIPNEGVDPIASTITDDDGYYFIDELFSGKYYVLAIYDINGNGYPDPGGGDPLGYYLNNPVEIKSSSLKGIDIDIKTIQLTVTSIFMQRQQSRNPYLISLTAKVVDPKTGEPLTNATVTANDPVSPQTYNLTYNPQNKQYERQFNPYSQNAVIAREGEYQFTIQHSAYGSQPIKLKIAHKPQNQLISIIRPQNNSTVETEEDLIVEWKNPSESDINMMLLVLRRVGSQLQEVFRDEDAPIENPYTIDGSVISNAGLYIINVISGRFAMVQNGISIEATSGSVMVNAQ